MERFGSMARRRYECLIGVALVDITGDAEPLGNKSAPGVGTGIRLYHLRNCRLDEPITRVGKPRHFVVYRRPEPDLVVVLRVLHEAMNLPEHLDEEDVD
jgi:toxin ParE1/3/4